MLSLSMVPVALANSGPEVTPNIESLIRAVKQLPLLPSSLTPVLKPEPTRTPYDDIGNYEAMKDYVLDRYADKEIKLLARTIYTEARGASEMQWAAVVWCILNRVDDQRWGSTVTKVVTQKNQFAYGSKYRDEHYEMAVDVLYRYEMEKLGYKDVGRVLPNDYFFFSAQGLGNKFRKEYKSRSYWDWSSYNPYEED